MARIQIDVQELFAKASGVLAGLDAATTAFKLMDPAVHVALELAEGDPVSAGFVVAALRGPARSILGAERVALNFLQHLSGVATETRRYVDAVSGTGATILDTRKTLPGLRIAQKYAVRAGGGCNHRMGLHDAVMLKENHVRAAGSLSAAIHAARSQSPELPLIVEVETLSQLEEALHAGCERILIDDFDAATRREAVRIARGAPWNGAIPLEVSGGVDLAGLRTIAAAGVDYISIGALTKHVHAIDLSMKLGHPE